jgi:hypothetical protein
MKQIKNYRTNLSLIRKNLDQIKKIEIIEINNKIFFIY